jgi:hypothetical protein
MHIKIAGKRIGGTRRIFATGWEVDAAVKRMKW